METPEDPPPREAPGAGDAREASEPPELSEAAEPPALVAALQRELSTVDFYDGLLARADGADERAKLERLRDAARGRASELCRSIDPLAGEPVSALPSSAPTPSPASPPESPPASPPPTLPPVAGLDASLPGFQRLTIGRLRGEPFDPGSAGDPGSA